MLETLNYDQPKDVTEYVGRELRRGNDFIVFELGPDLVAKRPNFERSSPRVRHEISSPEYYTELTEDNKKIKEIFGDNFEESTFYPASESRNFVVVQKRFKEEQFLHEELESENEASFISQHREDFINLVFGAKKAIAIFGYPVDLQPGNLVLDNNKVIFIEADCPSYRAKKFWESKGFAEKVQRDLDRLDSWEQALNLSDEERKKFNSDFGIESLDFERKMKAIRENLN